MSIYSPPADGFQRLHASQRGFVLVAGLIFLALVTLLAVTSLNRVTIDEKAASNLRDRNQTLIVADAALRHGETILGQLTEFPIPADNPDIWEAGGPITNENAIRDYLDASTWSPARTASIRSRVYGDGLAGIAPLPGRNNDPLPPPRYFIEDILFEADDYSTNSRGLLKGDRLYRVTGRATGSTEKTSPTLQSTYRKRYN